MTTGEKLSATDYEAFCLAVDAGLVQQHLDWLRNDFCNTLVTATIAGHPGVLAGFSLNIQSREVFTYAQPAPQSVGGDSNMILCTFREVGLDYWIHFLYKSYGSRYLGGRSEEL